MHSAKLTMTKYILVLIAAFGLQISAQAQENSPYSRYGIGDLTPSQNVITRAMGGVTAGYNDVNNPYAYQTINSTNPATYGSLSMRYAQAPAVLRPFNTIFELGSETDIRTLKSSNPSKKYSNTNALFSYLQLGFPIAGKKLEKKGTSIGMVLGFKPVSRINYSIAKNSRISGIDSISTLYEGTGGATQAFVGSGIRIKNFSIGFNTGYMFGNKDYGTRLGFINDTVTYYKSNSTTKTNFGGVFFNAGFQYHINLKNKAIIVIGAYGNLQQKLKASQDIIRETFAYDPNSNDKYRIDSVYESKNVKGKLEYPSSFGAGFTYQSEGGNLLFGTDFEMTQWSNYRFYNQADFVQNNWVIRAGAQYMPKPSNSTKRKYFNKVKYRAGFNYSPGYIKLTDNLPEYTATFGAGFPLTSLSRLSNEFVVLNTALEIGGRGNKTSLVRENITRFSIGLAMNARWFLKPKYD